MRYSAAWKSWRLNWIGSAEMEQSRSRAIALKRPEQAFDEARDHRTATGRLINQPDGICFVVGPSFLRSQVYWATKH
jgi:hypothetical protein